MVEFNPNAVAFDTGHFIDGKLVASRREETIPVLRPSDGATYAELPVGDAETIDHAVSAAKRAFRESGWAAQPPRTRAAIMRHWATLIERDAVRLSQIEAIGSTRPITDMLDGDIPHLAESIRFFAELADKNGGEVAATERGRFGMTITEPFGVIGVILPWNYPLGVAGWKLGPALAAGNAVVIKPSELTPFSVLHLAALAVEAGVPAGVFNVVQGTGETGAHLVRHPGTAKITFTGSTRVGAAITAETARHGLKPLTLELGGKSPQLVFPDADLDVSARSIAGSILNNAGQECVAGSRLVVHRDVKNALVERIAARMRDIRPGPTWAEPTSYPSIISERQLASIETTIAAAIAAGAEVLAGGSRLDMPTGTFLAPTILDRLAPGNPALLNEFFGSVLTVETFEDEDEGVALANDTDMGLAAGIYTRDLSRALRVMKRIEAGTIWINRYGRTNDFIIPTGGFKQSGFGKDLGREAFEANLKIKSVLIDL